MYLALVLGLKGDPYAEINIVHVFFSWYGWPGRACSLRRRSASLNAFSFSFYVSLSPTILL
jgi:hypothetical protein